MTQESVTIRLLHGEPAEMRELQRVLEEAPTYAHRITGVPPGRADAQSTYTALPQGKSYDDKFVFGIYRAGETVGCADLIRGYPDFATALLGLLLVSEKYQRQGIGWNAYALIEQFIRGWRTCDRVRIGVVRTNEAILPFWTHLGFEPTGEIKPYRYGSVVSETVVLAKRLPNSALQPTAASDACDSLGASRFSGG
jgi:RimJ/RimL family protein N-acetyltransferase